VRASPSPAAGDIGYFLLRRGDGGVDIGGPSFLLGDTALPEHLFAG
jgi:hypothetical protein